MARITSVELIWKQRDRLGPLDPEKEHWAYRVRRADGEEQTGPWDWPVDEKNESSMQEAVVQIAHEHGLKIEPAHVAVHGLRACYMNDEAIDQP